MTTPNKRWDPIEDCWVYEAPCECAICTSDHTDYDPDMMRIVVSA